MKPEHKNEVQDPKGRCQVCGEALDRDVIWCARCRTPHHMECWSFAGSCSTYGCGCDTPSTDPNAPAQVPLSLAYPSLRRSSFLAGRVAGPLARSFPIVAGLGVLGYVTAPPGIAARPGLFLVFMAIVWVMIAVRFWIGGHFDTTPKPGDS